MQKVDGIPRSLPAAETLARVTPSARSLGVTRLADITGLDRIGIPVYSSVVPDSDDSVSVYNGKGTRQVDAQVGALMEAIERQTALRARPRLLEGSFRELSRSRKLLDPLRINQKRSANYSPDRTYSWVEGYELLTGEPCWVPAKLAGNNWTHVPHGSCFTLNDTTGLASGNCREEAICHALCELAERDAWTMAELGAHQMPRQRRSLAYGAGAKDGPDDFEMFPCLEVESHELMAKFHRAGLHPVVRDITSMLQIPAIFAAVADDNLPGFPMAHGGLGAHPDASVALNRALTELAQSRCVDIQGVREDLVQAGEVSESFTLHTRRVSAIDHNSWHLGRSNKRRKLHEIPSYQSSSLQEDLQYLIARFLACGLDTIIVVNFTPPSVPWSVVRVIVPGIELWGTDHGQLGPRALEFWKNNV